MGTKIIQICETALLIIQMCETAICLGNSWAIVWFRQKGQIVDPPWSRDITYSRISSVFVTVTVEADHGGNSLLKQMEKKEVLAANARLFTRDRSWAAPVELVYAPGWPRMLEKLIPPGEQCLISDRWQSWSQCTWENSEVGLHPPKELN